MKVIFTWLFLHGHLRSLALAKRAQTLRSQVVSTLARKSDSK